jgi:sugar phosphate permease
MASQLGGAIAPLLVIPIQIHYGWRASFYVFGIVGLAWSAAWYWWFRDSPAEKAGVSEAELEETRRLIAKAQHGLPWKIALQSRNLWAVMGLGYCYIYTYYFFQSWFHTYLVKARGYSENDLLLSSLPFLVAACANIAGGLASNTLVQELGLKWGRRSIGLAGILTSAVCTAAVIFTHQRFEALILLSLVYGGVTFQQPAAFAVCLDIGGEYAGAVVGAFNTACQIGSLVSSVAFGYLVERYGSYSLPFLPMTAFLLIGAWLWLNVDPGQALIPRAVAPS